MSTYEILKTNVPVTEEIVHFSEDKGGWKPRFQQYSRVGYKRHIHRDNILRGAKIGSYLMTFDFPN